MKEKSPGQWYSALKRITSTDQQSEQINIEEIRHLSDQAEQIAESFCTIPNEYEALQTQAIQVPHFKIEDVPQFQPSQVWLQLTRLKTNKATTPGDFPAKLTKEFVAYIAEPLTDIINTSIRRGEYPQIYKYEVCTPVPKKYPPQTISEVRNISGLLTFDKILEKLISELIISDMSSHITPHNMVTRRGSQINTT